MLLCMLSRIDTPYIESKPQCLISGYKKYIPFKRVDYICIIFWCPIFRVSNSKKVFCFFCFKQRVVFSVICSAKTTHYSPQAVGYNYIFRWVSLGFFFFSLPFSYIVHSEKSNPQIKSISCSQINSNQLRFCFCLQKPWKQTFYCNANLRTKKSGYSSFMRLLFMYP